MAYKKMLSTALAFLAFFPSIKVSANPTNDLQTNQTSRCSHSGASWATIIIAGTTLCAVSGYAGYRLCEIGYFNKNKKTENLNPDKEINLVGPKYEDPMVTRAGKHRFELLAIDYIDKLLNVDIPKLKTSNEFPAQCLANVDGLCYIVPPNLEDIAEKRECHKTHGLSLKLKDKCLILQQIVENDNKITVGYLITLLNEIKELLQAAAPIIEENYYS